MMRKTLLLGCSILAVSVAAAAPAGIQSPRGAAQTAPVTFTEHIAPIIFDNCTTCHHTGEAVPFTLMSYDDVRRRGSTIAAVTASRYMPPWHGSSEMGRFRDERGLTESQIRLIRTWVDAGMPQGDPAKLPVLRQYTAGWSLGTPDLVVKMDRPFQIPADGPDIYRNFAIKLNLTSDKWVKAIDFRPSAKSSHHALYFLDPTGEAIRLQSQERIPGFTGMNWLGAVVGRGIQGILARGNTREQNNVVGLGGWAVGAMAYPLPEGLARPLPADSDLVLQMHFHPTGKIETEQATIAFYFADAPPKRTLSALQLPSLFGRFAGIDIPAGTKDFTIRDSFILPTDVDVIAMGGHAHYLATRMTMKATPPTGGTSRVLASIPNWDFNWQERYYFREPIRLAKGTRLDVEIHYDNSADNPHNPRNPPQRVQWGEQSLDEMGSLTLEIVPAQERDVQMLRDSVLQHVIDAALSARGPALPGRAGQRGRL